MLPQFQEYSGKNLWLVIQRFCNIYGWINNRVQSSFVSQSRNRWFLNIVLALGAVAFFGFSMLPLFESVIRESQPTTQATPAASPSPVSEQKSRLVNEAQSYEVVLKQEPNNEVALQGLVNARLGLGDLDGAIAPLEKLIALNPQDFRPLLVKATVLQKQGRAEQAKPLFEQATALAPAEYKDQIKDQIKQLSGEQPSATNTPAPEPKQGQGEKSSPAQQVPQRGDAQPTVSPSP